MTANLEAVFNEIVAERGGQAALSVAQMSMCKKLAELLTAEGDSDPAATARAIDVLSGLLPGRISDPEPPTDLTKLTDAEFCDLERLLGKARDQEVAPPIVSRKETPRELRAGDLARLIDVIEERGGSATDEEKNNARNLVVGVLYPLLPQHLFYPELFATPAPRIEPAPEPEEAAEPEPQPTPPAQRDDNVVPFSEAERGALKYGATFVSNDNPGHFGDFPRTRT